MVLYWVCGEEFLYVVFLKLCKFDMFGFGNSVGIFEGGIRVLVVVVCNFEEFEVFGCDNVEGKIVVFVVEWCGYGLMVQYCFNGFL